MHNLFLQHLDRVKNATEGVFGLANLAGYIERYTYLNGKLYSFKDHEFQKDVLSDTERTTITVKVAQIGLSELAYRWSIAACVNIEDFTVIYTFPNANDALNSCKTRIDPIIDNSPEVKLAVSNTLNNSEIKQFGRNSFIYMKGTRSQAGAVSVPADAVVHDEWDRSDITTASMYIARLQHKPHKIRKIFSTPTVAKYGVLKEAETAKRWKHMARCIHCSHRWLPDYFLDVKIPNFTGDLRDITKYTIRNLRWKEAYLACPKCGRDPMLSHETMEWVCENPSENFEAKARFISPFSAPNILTPSYLVKVSTEYERYSEFVNQGLGLAAENDDENLTEADIEKALVQAELADGSLHVFAADMGLTCHIAIGRMTPTGTVLVVHKEKVSYLKFEERRRELCIKYRCKMSVHDVQPYVDMVTRITQQDPNAYGAVFVTSKMPEPFRAVEQEEEAEEGRMNIRMVKVNRNMALDALMGVFKRGEIAIQKCALDDEFKSHMSSLKRIQKFDNNNDMTYVWEKTGSETDHFHFALLYLYAGIVLQGVAVGMGSVLSTLPIVTRFRTRL